MKNKGVKLMLTVFSLWVLSNLLAYSIWGEDATLISNILWISGISIGLLISKYHE